MATSSAAMRWGPAIMPWHENEASPPRQLLSEGLYSTQKESAVATGRRSLPIEDILGNCGSGSRCHTVSTYFIQHIRRYAFSGNWIVLRLDPYEETEEASPPSVGEKLEQIRDTFGLSMSALADILRSSRASVYNWFETEPHSAEILNRIEKLSKIAQKWQEMNPYHYPPGKLMKQKLGEAPSMLERLARDVLDNDDIRSGLESLLALMKKQRERMDRTKAHTAKTPADSESHKELLERLTGSVTAAK